MYSYIEKRLKDGIILKIFVRPNSPNDRLCLKNDELIAFISEPPRGGKANLALIKLLSRTFKKGKENFRIIRGTHERVKLVLVKGFDENSIINLTKKLICK